MFASSYDPFGNNSPQLSPTLSIEKRKRQQAARRHRQLELNRRQWAEEDKLLQDELRREMEMRQWQHDVNNEDEQDELRCRRLGLLLAKRDDEEMVDGLDESFYAVFPPPFIYAPSTSQDEHDEESEPLPPMPSPSPFSSSMPGRMASRATRHGKHNSAPPVPVSPLRQERKALLQGSSTRRKRADTDYSSINSEEQDQVQAVAIPLHDVDDRNEMESPMGVDDNDIDAPPHIIAVETRSDDEEDDDEELDLVWDDAILPSRTFQSYE